MLGNIFRERYRFPTKENDEDEICIVRIFSKLQGNKNKCVQTKKKNKIPSSIVSLIHSIFPKKIPESVSNAKLLLAVVPNFRIYVRIASGGVRSREEWAEIPKIGPLPIRPNGGAPVGGRASATRWQVIKVRK